MGKFAISTDTEHLLNAYKALTTASQEFLQFARQDTGNENPDSALELEHKLQDAESFILAHLQSRIQDGLLLGDTL